MDVKPVFCKFGAVSFALKSTVEDGIKRFEKEDIREWERAESSEWAMAVLPVKLWWQNMIMCRLFRNLKSQFNHTTTHLCHEWSR